MVAVSAPVDWLPLVAFAPVQPPEAVQPDALLELHVSVDEEPLATVVGLAARETDGGAGGVVTETATVWLTLPPAPEHVRVKSVAALSALLVSVPLVARSPLQPPEAEHCVEFAEFHVSVVELPTTTTDGLAATARVGAGVDPTLTAAVWLATPPAPVHVSVKLVVAAMASVGSLPLKPLLPLQPPDAAQLVAFEEFHVRFAVWPLVTVAGEAVREIVGAAGSVTLTVTVRPLLPPAPAQVSVKLVVAFSAPINSLPATALLPLQPSAAAQSVAFAALQVSVTAPPVVTLVGVALRLTDGGPPGSTATLSVPGPPDPAHAHDTDVARRTAATERIAGKYS